LKVKKKKIFGIEIGIESVLEHKLQREQFDAKLAEKEQSLIQTVNNQLIDDDYRRFLSF